MITHLGTPPRLKTLRCYLLVGLCLLLCQCGCTVGDYRSNESPNEAEAGTLERPTLSSAPGADPVSIEPRFLKYEPPAYPRLALRAGVEGEVTLEVHIDAKGTPDQVTVVRSSGTKSLDDAAVAAAYQCQYVAARDALTKVAHTVRYTVAFRLPGEVGR